MLSPPTEPSPERVRELFDRAVDLEPSARSAFLRQACSGDESLRGLVEALLDSDTETHHHSLWSAPAVVLEAGASAPAASPVLDRYPLKGRLGAGGMGVVYRAQRSDGAFEKEVAVKIVPWAAGDQKLLERFQEERSILARLDHPNIARLLDGGTTSDGLPYLVMEIAEGVPIDEYVERQKPSPRRLVELFRKICAAVSYAHHNLVVHRDLKPTNILVDANGEPKLLDFGVAKLLDKSEAMTHTRALTPEYASPEQISGAPATTASDVYALGVVLYELIAGRRPYRPTSGVMDLANVICKEEPLAPGREFDIDLANIVLMALRKEPARRYASAELLSEDLRRWLEGYPIAARPDTRGYRLRKFLGRNKLVVAAAVLVLLTLVGGVAATLREAAIANRRFSDVRRLANSYLFEFHDAIEFLPGSTAARQLVVKRGLEYLDAIAREHGNDRALMRELADAYKRMGSVQGAAGAANVGDLAGAVASYSKAAKLYEEILAGGKDANAAVMAAENYARGSQVLQQMGNVAAAAAQERKAVALVEAYAPVSKAAREILPVHYGILANIVGNPSASSLGHTGEALDLYRKARAGIEALLRDHPGDGDTRMRLASIDGQMGQMQQALGNGQAAVEAFRISLEGYEQLFKEHPYGTLDQRDAAVANNDLARAYVESLNSPREAQPYNERAVALARTLAEGDSNDVRVRIDLGIALAVSGRIAELLGNRSRALSLFNESLGSFEAARKLSLKAPITQSRSAYEARAEALIAKGDLSAARSDVSKQLEIDDEILRQNRGDLNAERNQAIAWAQTARIYAARQEWREALNWYGKAESMYIEQQQQGTSLGRDKKTLASVRAQIDACRRALAAQGHRR